MASSTIFLFLFISLQPYLSIANVTLNSSLSTNDDAVWSSPSGDFAFGFRQLKPSKLFILAIWYDKIPDRTIVWNAHTNGVWVPAPGGSKVELTASGLSLMDPNGVVLWEAKPAATISYAAMVDTGNFVLSGDDSNYLWQSFRNPTDTILPSQVLDLGSVLFARLTETDYSRGRFKLNFNNGNLELNPVAWPGEFQYTSYYSSQTYNTNPSESGYQLVFNGSTANLYIVNMNGEILLLPKWGPVNYSSNNYYRATLGFDGVFTQYAHPKNSQGSPNWSPVNFVPENICGDIRYEFGGGACGYNSICTLQNSRLSCSCPPGYVLVNPENNFGGCRPTFPQGCGQDDGLGNPEELYEIRQLEQVNWPLSDYERLEPYNQTECEKDCLHDCNCAVAVFGGSTCWKKRLPLSNGRWDTILTKVLFKVRKDVVPRSGYSDFPGKKDKPVLLAVFLGGSLFFNLFLLVVAYLFMFKRRKQKVGKNEPDSSFVDTNIRSFAYEELATATEGFREELGRGSFGIVYKGILKSGSRNVVVAVKKLHKLAHEGDKEFRTEVNAIGKTHHKNLLRLLGYCDEGPNRLLIYEFMSKGTLADFLFTLPRPDWHQRVKIALGIARGLLYLHEECDVPIIHCDVKPQNILLDDNFTARISDFGLAKLLLSDQTRTRTMIRGTRGYVALEWFKNVPVTAKVDVYSFGVMLLEIICCRRSVMMEFEEEDQVILTDWAYDCYIGGRFDLLVNNDTVAMDDRERLHKWVMIAIWCIQEDPTKRPTMKMVMGMLEGFLQVPLLPCPPSFNHNYDDSSWR